MQKLNALAGKLRKRSTNAEKLLWKHLRQKQIEGLKFRRQQAIDNYIVDFVCFENRLVIEIDGGQHSEEKDKERDSYLKKQGFRVIRFWNNEVLNNVQGVLEVIKETCLSCPPVKGR